MRKGNGLLPVSGLKVIVVRLEKTGSLQPGRGRKPVPQDTIEEDKTEIVNRAQGNIAVISSAHNVALNRIYSMKHFTKDYPVIFLQD